MPWPVAPTTCGIGGGSRPHSPPRSARAREQLSFGFGPCSGLLRYGGQAEMPHDQAVSPAAPVSNLDLPSARARVAVSFLSREISARWALEVAADGEHAKLLLGAFRTPVGAAGGARSTPTGLAARSEQL